MISSCADLAMVPPFLLNMKQGSKFSRNLYEHIAKAELKDDYIPGKDG